MKVNRKINLIVIHCSATDMKHDIHDIDDWHRKRGFKRTITTESDNKEDKFIGYHYVIDKDGDVFRGRDNSEIGSHAQGFNANSIGVCLIGDSQFTKDQLESCAILLDELCSEYSLQKTDIVPHCLLNRHKACPNINIYKEIIPLMRS